MGKVKGGRRNASNGQGATSQFGGHIAYYAAGSVAVAALLFVAREFQPHAPEWATVVAPAAQPVRYQELAALLAHAKAHDSLLALPHAHWFLRIRHDHIQIIAADPAPRHQGRGTFSEAQGR